MSEQSHRLAPLPALPQAGRQPVPGLALLDERAWPGQWLGSLLFGMQKEYQPTSSQVPDPQVLYQDLLSGGEQHQALPL